MAVPVLAQQCSVRAIAGEKQIPCCEAKASAGLDALSRDRGVTRGLRCEI